MHRGKMLFDSAMHISEPDGGTGRPPIQYSYRYHLGIVDFLQSYTTRKRLETMTKGMWSDKTRISAVNAEWYSQRFALFIKRMCGGVPGTWCQ